MLIQTQNELPRVKFSIGCGSSITVGLSLFYDTGAALNTWYNAYHRQIMKAHPQMVAKFEMFDGDNTFDPINYVVRLLVQMIMTLTNTVFLVQ